jgi:hypothetical protein
MYDKDRQRYGFALGNHRRARERQEAANLRSETRNEKESIVQGQAGSRAGQYLELRDHLHCRSNIHNQYRQNGQDFVGHQHRRNAMRNGSEERRNAELLARYVPRGNEGCHVL